MLIILLLFLGTALVGIKLRKGDADRDYLDKKTTGSICGICVFLVFMSHICGTMDTSFVLDMPAAYFCTNVIGQLMVVPFLFYSGYGITYQYLDKGKKYLKPFLIRRVLKVYLLAIICYVLRQLADYFIHGCTTFIFNPIELIYPSYWYIFVIIVEYLILFLTFIIFKKNKRAILIANIISSVALSLSLFFAGKDYWWYNTTIVFSFGVFWALYRSQIDQVLSQKKSFIILVIVGATIICACGVSAAFCMLYSKQNIYLFILYTILYFAVAISLMLLILLFTYKFVFGNKFLFTINLYTFHVYSLQRLTFEVFTKGVNVLSINRYLYFFSCLVLTASLAFIIKFLYDLFWKHTLGAIKFKN